MSAPSPTWYDLLGVEPSADADEIRAAWRSGIADLDPTERRFATLNEAAAVLLDPARRSAYDEELRAAQPEPEPVAVASTGSADVAGASTGSADEDAKEPAGERPGRAPYLVPVWVLATVAVVAIAAVVLAGVLSSRAPADKIVQGDAQVAGGSKVTQIEQPAQDAVAAAKEAVVPVLSYGYQHLDADQAKARGYLTPSYRAKYDKLFDALKKSAASTKTTITTKVVSSGIVRADSDRVQVLLFIDRPTTNAANTTPVQYQDQTTLTMEKVGSRWLVDNMVTNQIPD